MTPQESARVMTGSTRNPADLARRFVAHLRTVEAGGEPGDGAAGAVAFYYAASLIGMASAPTAGRRVCAVWEAQERARLALWDRHGWPELAPATGELYVPEERLPADQVPADYSAWCAVVAGEVADAHRAAFREACEAAGAADLADLAEGDPGEYERRRLLGLHQRVTRQLEHRGVRP